MTSQNINTGCVSIHAHSSTKTTIFMSTLKSKLLIPVLFALLGLLASCSAHKDIVYLQNERFGESEAILNLNKIKIQPHDQVSIIVSCKEQELADLFNLKRSQLSGGGTNTRMGYTVDDAGNITFPNLGPIHIAGLTRDEISKKIANLLIAGKWISDPIVTVEFNNLHFSALGEVKSPGSYPITNDHITLLEALSMAGDLSIHGERDIMVIREQNGKRVKYMVDLRDNNLYDSPVYYLQQNDVIYVKPDQTVARQAADNPNNFKSISFWMSIASFLTSMAILIFK